MLFFWFYFFIIYSLINNIITKIFIYVAILLIGYFGKRIGVFKKEHTKFLNYVICYITLPAAIINGFQNVTLTPILLVVCLLGFCQLFFIGMLGEYLYTMNARILHRPLVIEAERLNFDEKDN